MRSVLREPVTLVWLLLIRATALLFLLAESRHAAPAMTAAMSTIAAFKVRLVFLHFMQLASGVMPWRALAEAWVLVVTALIPALYFATPG